MDYGWTFILLILAFCALMLAFGMYLNRWVMSKDEGTHEMRQVSDAIRAGAEGFLKTQYGAITKLSGVVGIILFLAYLARDSMTMTGGNYVSRYLLGFYTLICFLLGATFSGLCGYIGMHVSVRTNIRVAAAARRSYNEAIQVCLRGGAVCGFLVVTLSVSGLTLLFAAFYAGYGSVNFTDIPSLIVGYGFGASFVALFAQLGGGIYTKAADVGADIVGKVESSIPEDDPRNPAVIADLVGDNVGDCAGRGADLYESIAAENLGAMILAASLVHESAQLNGNEYNNISYVIFPLAIHIFGLVSNAIGVMLVKTKNAHGERQIQYPVLIDRAEALEDPMAVLKRGYSWSVVLSSIGFIVASYIFLHAPGASTAWIWFAGCGLLGIAVSYAFVLITQYYTDFNFTPVQRIAEASKTGHGTNVIAGMAVGMESTFLPAICISIALIAAYYMGLQTGITTVNSSGGTDSTYAGIFGTACATMGMLSTASYILAMDTFGPIADNAGGIAEMSQQPDEVRVITDRLDAVGNTTKALTKGYAIGSASLATFLLFRAFLDLAKGYYAPTISANATYSMLGLNVPLPALLDEIFAVDFSVPEIFIGGLLGAAVVMLFSSFAMRAVGVAAQAVVVEVRRQFQMFPGIMDFSQKPDYTTCVSIVAESALREMIKPGLLVVLTPVVVGLTFRVIGIIRGQPANNPFVGARNDILGALTVAGLLMIGTITGIMMALNLNNAGGAWDNAKKFIEIQGNKGSDQHKSAVTGDTVGDPCKDTAGPSIHVLIKLLATVTLVLAPIFVTSRN